MVSINNDELERRLRIWSSKLINCGQMNLINIKRRTITGAAFFSSKYALTGIVLMILIMLSLGYEKN
jgi:hypothetical protein